MKKGLLSIFLCACLVGGSLAIAPATPALAQESPSIVSGRSYRLKMFNNPSRVLTKGAVTGLTTLKSQMGTWSYTSEPVSGNEFTFTYVADQDAYVISYPYQDLSNSVVAAVRSSGSTVDANREVYLKTQTSATNAEKYWIAVPLGEGLYKFLLKDNQNLALRTTTNGTAPEGQMEWAIAAVDSNEDNLTWSLEDAVIQPAGIYRLKHANSGKYVVGCAQSGSGYTSIYENPSSDDKYILNYDPGKGAYTIQSRYEGFENYMIMAQQASGSGASDDRDIYLRNQTGLTDAQKYWRVNSAGDGKFTITLRDNTSLQLYPITGGMYPGQLERLAASTNATNNTQLWEFEEAGDAAVLANGTYYMRNASVRKYLDASNGGTASGTNTAPYDFHGNTNQQWAFTRLENGYYVIRPGYNSALALRVKQSAGNNVELLNVGTANTIYLNTDAQWKVIRMGNDTYRLIPRSVEDQVLASVYNASTGYNASTTAYTGSAVQQWILELAPHSAFSAVGIPDTASHDHTSYMTDIASDVTAIGVSTYYKRNNCTNTLALGDLGRTSFWVGRSHGAPTAFVCKNGNITSADINALPDNALCRSRLILFGACSTGGGGASADNLVNASYNKGAKTVIGFLESVYCGHTNTFTKAFIKACGQGKTVANALTDADYQVSLTHGGDAGYTDQRLVRGSTIQKLTN